MNKKKTVQAGTAAERILGVATDLFYKQGYRATGINEVIDKSGVAKATFYKHFPSKDELYEACLLILRENELHFVDDGIHQAKDARERYMSVIVNLKPWAINTDFRGCAFLNVASEIPDSNSRLRKVGRKLYDDIRTRVEKLAKELIGAELRYSGYDAEKLTEHYMVVFSGAVALAQIYHAIWPIEQAIDSIERIIGE